MTQVLAPPCGPREERRGCAESVGKQVPWVEWFQCMKASLLGNRRRVLSSYTAPVPTDHNPIHPSPTRPGASKEQDGV